MQIKRADGYELSDDKARIDLAAVTKWISVESYWAQGRPRSKIEASIAKSDAYGVYDPEGRQVAFARMVTDRETFGWLCDVFVDAEHRGRGLGTWLVGALRDEYRALGVRRLLLSTMDAHGVYASVGFTPLSAPDRWMEMGLVQSKA